ncbi:MAG TPA: hypothetical protein VKB51_05375 [bacterium]|nr:hypothetical protein [bacterium]
MSLVARHLEENGIPTVVYSVARDITERAFTPRAVFTNYPLGNPCGRPRDPENQRAILRTGLRLLEQAAAPGTLVETPYVWSDGRDWMRLIFSDEQPFLTPEAEAQRQAELERARQQKLARRQAGD